MVGGNESSGCKPGEQQGGWLDDGVGECSVVWSAVSLLKKSSAPPRLHSWERNILFMH